jgi:predicted  nucleic acid-binding Zn-ribbon protein
MDEQLGLLIQLQEVDSKIRSLMEQKKRLPEFLADLDQKREANKANLESVKETLAAAQKNKRDRDQDLEAGVQKVEKLKARSSEIKNNKEYQALLKEIETGEKDNKAIEDDILVLMEKIDEAASKITIAEQRSREEEAVLQAEQQQREADFAKMSEDLKEIERERQKVVAAIKPDILGQYEKLLNTKAGIAIAEARNESCSGCFMSIPPQIFVNVKKNNTILTCPNCHRILYYKEVIVSK